MAAITAPSASPAIADKTALVSQPSIDDKPQLDGEELAVGPTWVHDRLAAAVDIIASGTFEAIECGACRYCPFAASCPALHDVGGDS